MLKIRLNIVLSFLLLFSGCASYEKFRQISEELEIPSKVYKADFTQTWKAVIKVMSIRFDIENTNRETGKITTKWMDNTLEVNFTDSFASSEAVKAAERKIIISVAEGYSYGRKVTKVTIFKRQKVEHDFLQGWREIPTDGIVEKTLLYRIGVIIENDNKKQAIAKKKEKELLENF